MKKYLLSLLLLVGLASFAKADSFFGGEDKLYMVHYSTSLIAATISTDTILIDLSDTVNWPHKETGEIQIQSISVVIDKVAASTGSVKIGVVNTVNSSTGSVSWIKDFQTRNNLSNSAIIKFDRVDPTYYRCRVNSQGLSADGLTPYFLTNDKTVASTTFQNDVALSTTFGPGVFPATGDIILEINKDASNAWNVDIEVSYNSKPR